MKRSLILFTLTVALLALSSPSTTVAQNAIPINYQGLMTDSSGNPLTGTYSITFRLWDAAAGGTMLWSETHASVSVSSGVFNVMLGSVTPISIDVVATGTNTGNSLWLETQIGADPAITPRTQLGAVPFSVISQRMRGDLVSGDGLLWMPQAEGLTGPGIPVDTFGIVMYAKPDPGDVTRTGISINAGDGSMTAIKLEIDSLGTSFVMTGTNGDTSVFMSGGGLGEILLKRLPDDGSRIHISPDGLVLVNTAGDTLVKLETGNADLKGPLSIGGNGTDGSLILRDSTGSTIVTLSDAGLTLRDFISVKSPAGALFQAAAVYLIDTTADTVFRASTDGDLFVSGEITSGSSIHIRGSDGLTQLTNDIEATNPPVLDIIADETKLTGDLKVAGTGSFGILNTITGNGNFVAGGGHTAGGDSSTISGGNSNETSNFYATIGGGLENNAGGNFSSIPGGLKNMASGDYSFAAGRRAKANHAGTFVWADNTAADFTSTGINQFLIRASGGVGIGTGTPQTGFHLSIGSGEGLPTAQLEPHQMLVSNNALASNQADVIVISGTSGKSSIGFGDATNAYMGRILYNNATESMEIWVANTQKIKIDNANFMTVTANLRPGADDTYDLGTSVLRWTNVWATNGTIQTSDARQKKNVEDVKYGLNEILQLRPVSYKWKENSDESTHIGLIAQEVQKIVSEVVVVGDDQESILGLRYQGLIPILINAIKELNNDNDQLTTRMTEQARVHATEMESLKTRLKSLEKLVKMTLAVGDDM